MTDIVPPTPKKCSQCHQKKARTQFNRNSSKRDGLDYTCRECRESYRLYWYEKNHAKVRDKDMYRRYGITKEEYDLLLEKQNGVCAIFKQLETKTVKRSGRVWPLAVDHNHETGHIRGLLCSRCNRVLGLVKEDAQILQSMIEYL